MDIEPRNWTSTKLLTSAAEVMISNKSVKWLPLRQPMTWLYLFCGVCEQGIYS